jgi:hypothetical protein
MKRILSESINIGDTVNLYSEANEIPRSFIGQAKITNILQDKTTAPQSIPYFKKPKKKPEQIRARIKKIFSLEIPHFDKPTLEFECGGYFKFVHSKGEQEVYNRKLHRDMTKEYCSTKTTFEIFPGGLQRWDVPKADYSSTQGTSSTMAEGKKVIRLTESDLVKIVKRIISEQNAPVKLKKGDIVTIVKKGDTTSKPVETDAMVKVVYDAGNGQQRIGYKISGGNEVQTDFDPKKMEFQGYKIVKVNGMGLGELSLKGEVTPPSEPKKNLVLSPETLKRLGKGKSQTGQKILSPDTLKRLGYK